MTILISTTPASGDWAFAIRLTRALKDRNVRVALAILGGPISLAQRREMAALREVRWFESEFQPEWSEGASDDIHRGGRWLLETEQRVRPAVVQLCCVSHAALPFAAPTVAVAHRCMLSRHQAVTGTPAPRSWNGYRDHVTSGLSRVDMLVAPTQSTLHDLERQYGALPPARVIAPAADAIEPIAPFEKDELILSVGKTWDAAKNFSLLSQAAAAVPWAVCVVGDDTPRTGGRVRPGKNVITLGQLAPLALQSWYERAAVFAAPSHYASMGLSALDAANHGCALVLSDLPAMREQWDGAAMFVDPANPNALQAALWAMICNPSRRHELANAARMKAEARTMDRMAFQFMSTYEHVLRVQRGIRAHVEPRRHEGHGASLESVRSFIS